MAARKPKAYRVSGAAAVIRKDNHERYLYRGAVFAPDALDDDNAKHLLAVKLIEPVFQTDEEIAAEKKAAAEAEAAAKKKAADEAAKQQTPPAS